ncbi:hypothetical protein H0H87_007150 [Tephrocybe sp. NHM501043]|nr:hypothetical protein H0H87_007150 [Tephrocybe sp. NHM501043]
MRLSNILWKSSSVCLTLGVLTLESSAYFVITEPTRQTQWTIGTSNTISWQKGVRDGITVFDVEMARLSTDGLTLVARNDVPEGDDYFLLFLNSTHGVMHATSPRFSIVSASSAKSTASVSAASNAQTVTISGAPNPTRQFAATFAALASEGIGRWGDVHKAWSLGGAVVGCVVGAVWTLS